MPAYVPFDQSIGPLRSGTSASLSWSFFPAECRAPPGFRLIAYRCDCTRVPPGFWCVLLVPPNRSESNRLHRQYMIMKIWKSDLSAVCLGVSPYFLSFLVIAPKKRIIQQVDLWMPQIEHSLPQFTEGPGRFRSFLAIVPKDRLIKRSGVA